MSFKLYLIRHGSTSWNESQRHQGRLPGIGLSPAGIEQVKAQAQWLAVRDFATVVSSPLQRAVESASILLGEWGQETPIALDERFNEWDIPAWNRMTLAEIARSAPEAYALLEMAPQQLALPGAETLHDVQTRTMDGIRDLKANHPDAAVLVVTHAAVVVAAICGLLNIPLSLFRQLPVANASLTIIEVADRPKLRMFNWHPSQLA